MEILKNDSTTRDTARYKHTLQELLKNNEVLVRQINTKDKQINRLYIETCNQKIQTKTKSKGFGTFLTLATYKTNDHE